MWTGFDNFDHAKDTWRLYPRRLGCRQAVESILAIIHRVWMLDDFDSCIGNPSMRITQPVCTTRDLKRGRSHRLPYPSGPVLGDNVPIHGYNSALIKGRAPESSWPPSQPPEELTTSKPQLEWQAMHAGEDPTARVGSRPGRCAQVSELVVPRIPGLPKRGSRRPELWLSRCKVWEWCFGQEADSDRARLITKHPQSEQLAIKTRAYWSKTTWPTYQKAKPVRFEKPESGSHTRWRPFWNEHEQLVAVWKWTPACLVNSNGPLLSWSRAFLNRRFDSRQDDPDLYPSEPFPSKSNLSCTLPSASYLATSDLNACELPGGAWWGCPSTAGETQTSNLKP